ncbi:MAG: RluA family pseudouridine synthase [Verrucomicrobia bacterium]|nr:RluA family pseudouridine synthase [Verrucomicrobiota bacterium]
MNPARTETFTIEQSLPGERLDKFLVTRYPAVSRGAVQRLIDEGHIRVNGAPVKPTHSPRAGEVVTVHFPEPKPAIAQPQAIALDVLYEDDALLVVNKPAGMATHPGAGHEDHTLVNALLHHCAGRLSGIGGVARPGIVHRLDLDTSGVLVVAKDDIAHLALQKQFAARSLDKIYLALVCGNSVNDTGTIRAPIARHQTQRKKMAVRDEGRDSLTTFRVAERLGLATLMEVRIHTGRTHQIRVHFQHIGYPVFGDAAYGAKSTAKLTELTGYTPPRQLLHAHRLTFRHPGRAEEMTFEAPVPKDFEEALRVLRRAAKSRR